MTLAIQIAHAAAGEASSHVALLRAALWPVVVLSVAPVGPASRAKP